MRKENREVQNYTFVLNPWSMNPESKLQNSFQKVFWI